MKKNKNHPIPHKMKNSGFGPAGFVFFLLLSLLLLGFPGSTQTLPQFRPVEYRLFNLSVLVPRSFRASEVNAYRVRFSALQRRQKDRVKQSHSPGFLRSGTKSGNMSPSVSLEVYYFPSFLKDTGPQNMKQFLAKVWPEYSYTEKKRNKNHGSLSAVASAIGFLQKKQSFQDINLKWVGFKVTNKIGKKIHVWLVHWRDRNRRYFAHVNVSQQTIGLYQFPVITFLRSLDLLYRPRLDIPPIDILLAKFIYTGHKRLSFSAKDQKLLFHKPFFYQGQPMNVTDWLDQFSGIKLHDRKWILLDQEALSQEKYKNLSAGEMAKLKGHLRQFSYTFTAGDVVAYVPAKNTKQGKRLRWSYFLLKKVLGQWRIYGMGMEVLSSSSGKKDKPDHIIW